MPRRLPPAWVLRPVFAARNGLTRLRDALGPPELLVMERTLGVLDTAALATAAELGVADALARGPATTTELAATAGAEADALARLLRYLVARGVFRRRGDGRWANNRASALLASSHPGSLSAWARFFGSPWHLALWARLGHAVRTGDSAAAVAFGRPFWEQLTEHDPEAGTLFAAAMAAVSRLQLEALAARPDFATCRDVCDVGGGTGTLLAGVLAAHRGVRGTLFDLPEVVAGAGPVLEAAGVADRVEVVGGDFFSSVPEARDRYVLQAVVHDWDDDSCVRILGNVRRALAPGGRVLVVEQELPRHRGWHPAKAVDLEMLVDTGAGRERTRAEFDALFARAGLRVTGRQALPVATIVELAPS
jgi:SAM-dependent methyltransferase